VNSNILNVDSCTPRTRYVFRYTDPSGEGLYLVSVRKIREENISFDVLRFKGICSCSAIKIVHHDNAEETRFLLRLYVP
jgi:hypothetical protein